MNNMSNIFTCLFMMMILLMLLIFIVNGINMSLYDDDDASCATYFIVNGFCLTV